MTAKRHQTLTRIKYFERYSKSKKFFDGIFRKLFNILVLKIKKLKFGVYFLDFKSLLVYVSRRDTYKKYEMRNET